MSPNEYLAQLLRKLPAMSNSELQQQLRLELTRLTLRAAFDTRPLTAVKAERNRRRNTA
jgi:hypothetical protein